MPSRELDESDFRPRPNRRGTRPRTKRRPDYAAAPVGTAITIDRGRLTLLLDHGVEVTAARSSRLRRTQIVPGDRVRLDGDVSGAPGSLARIVEVEPRRTLLRRSADDGDTTERPLVANADLVAIVTAAADPEPRPHLIDRAIAAALDAGIDALVAVTKTDLASPEPLERHFAEIDVPVVAASGLGGEADLAELRRHLQGRTTVLIGHSGVGKSTLINGLVPQADRATGAVNTVTGRGRHTSSSALMLALPGDEGGWVIDTPGIRSFGLAHLDSDGLLEAFPELLEAAARCPRGCQHLEDSPGCQLGAAVEAGQATADRLHSFRRLQASLLAG